MVVQTNNHVTSNVVDSHPGGVIHIQDQAQELSLNYAMQAEAMDSEEATYSRDPYQDQEMNH